MLSISHLMLHFDLLSHVWSFYVSFSFLLNLFSYWYHSFGHAFLHTVHLYFSFFYCYLALQCLCQWFVFNIFYLPLPLYIFSIAIVFHGFGFFGIKHQYTSINNNFKDWCPAQRYLPHGTVYNIQCCCL